MTSEETIKNIREMLRGEQPFNNFHKLWWRLLSEGAAYRLNKPEYVDIINMQNEQFVILLWNMQKLWKDDLSKLWNMFFAENGCTWDAVPVIARMLDMIDGVKKQAEEANKEEENKQC